MCAALRPLQACPLSGGKFRFPSRPSLASIRWLCRPGWACFFFFCLSFARLFSLLRGGAGFLSSRFAGAPDSSTTGPHAPNRVCEELHWCPFPYPARKIAHRPSQGRVWFHRLFPSLSRWKPGKQQICVHDNLPGAQSQDENLIGKKRFSLPWLSLASPPHFFSRPPSYFSNSVLRSLFFVYSTANFEAASP